MKKRVSEESTYFLLPYKYTYVNDVTAYTAGYL